MDGEMFGEGSCGIVGLGPRPQAWEKEEGPYVCGTSYSRTR